MIIQDRFTKADASLVQELLRAIVAKEPVPLDSLSDPWIRRGRISILQVHDDLDLAYMPGQVAGKDFLAHVDGSGVFRTLFSISFIEGDDRNDILTAIMSNGVGVMVPVAKDPMNAPFYGTYFESDGIDDEDPEEDPVVEVRA